MRKWIKKLKHKIFVYPFINNVTNIEKYGLTETKFTTDISENGDALYLKEIVFLVSILGIGLFLSLHSIFIELGLFLGSLVFFCGVSFLFLPSILLFRGYKIISSYIVKLKYQKRKGKVDSITEYIDIVGEKEVNKLGNILYYLNLEKDFLTIHNMLYILAKYSKDKPDTRVTKNMLGTLIKQINELENNLSKNTINQYDMLLIFSIYKNKVKLDILDELNTKIKENKIDISEDILEMNNEMVVKLYNDFNAITDLKSTENTLKITEETNKEKIKSKELIELFHKI